jgi:hypothetical protein
MEEKQTFQRIQRIHQLQKFKKNLQDSFNPNETFNNAYTNSIREKIKKQKSEEAKNNNK